MLISIYVSYKMNLLYFFWSQTFIRVFNFLMILCLFSCLFHLLIFLFFIFLIIFIWFFFLITISLYNVFELNKYSFFFLLFHNKILTLLIGQVHLILHYMPSLIRSIFLELLSYFLQLLIVHFLMILFFHIFFLHLLLYLSIYSFFLMHLYTFLLSFQVSHIFLLFVIYMYSHILLQVHQIHHNNLFHFNGLIESTIITI